MTNHVVRLYAFAIALVVMFVAWAAIAARPWAHHAAAPDPRLKALQARQVQVRRDSIYVNRVVAHRWQRYRVQLKARRKQIAAAVAAHQQAVAAAQAAVSAAPSYSAPSYSGGGGSYAAPAVRTVTLPPITITRTS